MSIEQEIKGIIDNAMSSHSQSQEIDELRGKVENLTKLVNSLILTNTNNNSNMPDANFRIKQGEVFISPAIISGQISCSRESLGKEIQKTVSETISSESQRKGSPLWNAINGDRAGNWESRSDTRLMEEKYGKTMFISIDNNGLSVSYNWQTATYWDNGNMKTFFGNDEKHLPERIVFRDTRTKSNRSE